MSPESTLTTLVDELRTIGVGVSVGEHLDAARALAAVPLARAFAAERNMFLSLNSVLLQGRVHWPDFARLAAQIGFPGTDVMLKPAMEAGVSATNALCAHLSDRRRIFSFPLLREATWVVVDERQVHDRPPSLFLAQPLLEIGLGRRTGRWVRTLPRKRGQHSLRGSVRA